MMGYIMRQLRKSKSLTQPQLAKLIQSQQSLPKGSKPTPGPTLQRRISHIENFDHLERAAAEGHMPIARELFLRTAGEGLGLSQLDIDALLWLMEGKGFQPLNREELASHRLFDNSEEKQYQDEDLRRHSLLLLERAVKIAAKLARRGEYTRVRMLTGWEEEHQVEFREQLLRMEDKPGQRLLISKYPSLLTYPGDALEHLDPNENELSASATDRIRELHAKRKRIFTDTLRQYGERCIHSGESLKRYVGTEFGPGLPWNARRDHVAHLIKLLKENDYFQVALALTEPEMKFVIKSGQEASLRGTARHISRPNSVICGPLYIFWDNKTTVYSFMVDFEHAWQKIPPEQRDKDNVILELQSLIDG
jgi:transcriptional regulator with XRE-family HTH domain